MARLLIFALILLLSYTTFVESANLQTSTQFCPKNVAEINSKKNDNNKYLVYRAARLLSDSHPRKCRDPTVTKPFADANRQRTAAVCNSDINKPAGTWSAGAGKFKILFNRFEALLTKITPKEQQEKAELVAQMYDIQYACVVNSGHGSTRFFDQFEFKNNIATKLDIAKKMCTIHNNLHDPVFTVGLLKDATMIKAWFSTGCDMVCKLLQASGKNLENQDFLYLAASFLVSRPHPQACPDPNGATQKLDWFKARTTRYCQAVQDGLEETFGGIYRGWAQNMLLSNEQGEFETARMFVVSSCRDLKEKQAFCDLERSVTRSQAFTAEVKKKLKDRFSFLCVVGKSGSSTTNPTSGSTSTSNEEEQQPQVAIGVEDSTNDAVEDSTNNAVVDNAVTDTPSGSSTASSSLLITLVIIGSLVLVALIVVIVQLVFVMKRFNN